MAIKIDRELIENVNDPSIEVIVYCIKEHQKELERLQRLSDAYDGKHDILERKKESSNEMTNVMVNNAKYVTDINVGFTFGNPIAYTPGEGKKIDAVLDVFDEISIKKHDRELGKDLSVYGYGLELLYLTLINDEPKLKIACIDPRGMFLVTDDSVDGHSLFAVRYIQKYNLEGGKDGYNVEVYTAAKVTVYRVKDLNFSEYEIKQEVEHAFKAVPVVEFRNNEEKQGDFEQAMTLIEAYNVLQSDRINDKEAFIDAILVLYGFSLDDTDRIEGGDKNLLQAPAKVDGVGAEWLTKTFSESDVQVLSKSIEKDIHKVTYTPNLNDESFAGTVSGEAMKYKLFGLLQLLVTKIGYFEDGVKQRLQLMENILNVQPNNVDVSGTKITMTPNLPINTSDVIENVIKAYQAGILPLETLLSWIPEIDDPSEEIKKLYVELEEKIKMNQKAFGEPSPSLDEDDVEIEEDENE